MYPKLFRKIFKNVIPPDDQARFMIEDTVDSAFKLFQDKTFRKEIEFVKLEQVEQDRIFNELEVTFLGFLYLVIDNTSFYLSQERAGYWSSVKGSIFPLFINWFKELGIKNKHIKTWEKLIDLRLDEYKRGLKETKDIWQNEINKHAVSEKLQNEAIILGSIVISAMLHIRRGQSSSSDPLKKILGTWMGLLVQKWKKEIV